MKRILTTLSAVLTAAALFSQIPAPLQVRELKLKNGMTVWLNEDHSQPKVYGEVVVRAGAKDCPNTGIAHYFEHIMFKGTDRLGTVDYEAERPWLDSISHQYDLLSQTRDERERAAIQQHINKLSLRAADYAIPNEFSRLISKYGGSGLNASTGPDMTGYYNTFLPQYISQWCHLNAHRLQHPVFRGFQGELENVYEEKNRGSDGLMEVLDKALKEIQDGTFARNWLLENRAAGRANFHAQRRLHAEHQIEKVGAELRNMMPWLRDAADLSKD